MNVKDKVIVVSGGTKGLGKELVFNLLEKGAYVAVVGRSKKSFESLIQDTKEYKTKISTHVVDITDKKAVEKLPEEVIVAHGSVDGLINNAGIIQPFVGVNDLDYETIDRVMQTNFYGHLYMIKSFLPVLLKRPEAHIVNVDSMGGFFPFPGQTVYGASKAALKLLSEGLTTELVNTNVKVMTVFPGALDTNIAGNSGVEVNESMKEMGGGMKTLSPQKAAEIIVKAMEKNRQLLNVGTDAKMMSLFYRLFPAKMPMVFAKIMGDKLMGK